MLLSLSTALADSIRINEFMAANASYTNADGTTTDWIELYNTNTLSVSLANYSLTDSNLFPQRYIFSNTVTIPGRGFFVLKCDSSKPAATNNAPMGLGKSGGYIYLYAPGASLVDAVQYGIQAEDYSVGRVPEGNLTNWALCTPTMRGSNVPVVLGTNSLLKINEWMADDGNNPDWFELYNPTNKPVSLAGLWLNMTNTTKNWYQIPALSYMGYGFAHGYLKFIADGNTNAYNADHTPAKLSKSAEQITLFAANSTTIIDRVAFVNQSANVSEGRLPDGSTNIVRFPKMLGTYTMDSAGEPNWLITTNLIISELLSHCDPPFEDAVEFQNVSTNSIDISGWWISNDRLNPLRARIPTGPAIPPGGFRVIYQYMFNFSHSSNYPPAFSTNGILDEFTFNSAHGDECHLFQTDTNGNLTGYEVMEIFESAANGVPFGHYNTTVAGDYKFIAMSSQTFGTSVRATDSPSLLPYFRTGLGASNSYPLVGPVVINEIMYQPSNTYWGTNIPPQLPKQNPDEEYIELRNITGSWVPLYFYDPANPSFMTNSWRIQKALDYSFPSNSWMAPYSFCLVVAFDPKTNYTALTNFCKRYNVSTNSAATNYVPLYGPWSGRLSDTGDSLELYHPDTPQTPPHPDAGYVPFIRMDKVNFLSSADWSSGASGTGLSLQRLRPSAFGNDPINWTAYAVSAGLANVPGDNDGDGMLNDWEIRYGLNPNDPSDADLDPDHDGMTNLQEYWAGTNPTNAASVLRLFISYPNTNSPLLLTFFAVSNLTYRVQDAGHVDNPNWSKLYSIPAALTNRWVTVTDTNPASGDHYYRVRTPD